jgi:hypothetical protein
MTTKYLSLQRNKDITFNLGARSSVAYDANNDGLTDFVLEEYKPNNGYDPKTLHLYQQNKKGKLIPVNTLNGYTPIIPNLKIADINNDGTEDLIIFDLNKKIGLDSDFSTYEPGLFLGRKDESPIKSTMLTDAYTQYSLINQAQPDGRVSAKDFAIADIDNDGDLDIWVESTGGKNVEHHFLVNNGSHFSVDTNRILSNITKTKDTDFFRYNRAHFEDLNNDGYQDLVFAQLRDEDISHIDGTSITLTNDGKGFFSLSQRLPHPEFNSGFTRGMSIATADINNDGMIDIVIAHREHRLFIPGKPDERSAGNFLQILRQESDGSFTDSTNQYIGDQHEWSKENLPYTNEVRDMDFVDLNNDGWDDLLINYWSNFNILGPTILLNQNGSSFTAAEPSKIANYDGENNFFWDKEKLKSGELLAYTQLSDDSILATDTLFTVHSPKKPINKPKQFKRKFADEITGFGSSANALAHSTGKFAMGNLTRSSAGKNNKIINKLANQDFEAQYDQERSGLGLNENGTHFGLGDSGIIAILKDTPGQTSAVLGSI